MAFHPSSDEDLDRNLQRLIITIEDMPVLDMGELGERTGLGEEASSIYRHYVAEKGLLAKSTINFFKLGLHDTYTILKISPIFNKAIPAFMEASIQNNFIISALRPMGQNVLITRELVPLGEHEKLKYALDELSILGIIEGYEIFKADQVVNRWSLNPSAFDYVKGKWRTSPLQASVERKFKVADLNPVKFDAADLKIVQMLKKSAATKPEAIAASLNLSVDEAELHLKSHVLGGVDPKKSVLLGSSIDFFEPGLFAPETSIIAGFFSPEEEVREDFLNKLVKNPYLTFFASCDKYFFTLFSLPTDQLYVVADSLNSLEENYLMADFRFYFAPWFNNNKYGDPHNQADISRSFVKGKWEFNLGDFFDNVKQIAKSSI